VYRPRKYTKADEESSRSSRHDEVRLGENATSGGSSDTEQNDWHVIPTGASLTAVTTAMPEAHPPIARRNAQASNGGVAAGWIKSVTRTVLM